MFDFEFTVGLKYFENTLHTSLIVIHTSNISYMNGFTPNDIQPYSLIYKAGHRVRGKVFRYMKCVHRVLGT